jgi:plasmid stability protein
MPMPDLRIRNIDTTTYERMKIIARTQRKSLVQLAREALAEKFRPSREEAWAEADRLRAKIGKVSGDSTADIRAWRDNDERYR